MKTPIRSSTLVSVLLLFLELVWAARPAFAVDPSTLGAFTDRDLQALLASGKAGIIAVVSPHMPLSIQNLDNIQKIAKKRKLALAVVVDGQASDDFPEVPLNKLRSDGVEPRLDASPTLDLQGSLLHYPTLHYYDAHGLSPVVIYGAKSLEAYDYFLSNIAAGAAASSSADARPFDPSLLPLSPDWKESARLKLPRTPKYYFKPLATGAVLAYQSSWSNYLIDLSTGRETLLPGTIDPVPSPDERILTIPSIFAPGGHGTLGLYRLDDLAAGRSEKDALVLRDKNIPGTYQSVGQRTENGKTYYRVISESLFARKGFFFQDYEAVEDLQGRIVKLIPGTKGTRTLCPGISFALPFLSKTGKLFSGVDPLSRKSRIYSVDSQGACTLKAELPFPTGKMDFSFDDRLAVFHLSAYSPKRVTEVMNLPDPRLGIDAYIYEIATGKLSRLTDCGDANCYYPGFRKNGDIVYLRQDGAEKRYSFVTLKSVAQ